MITALGRLIVNEEGTESIEVENTMIAVVLYPAKMPQKRLLRLTKNSPEKPVRKLIE
jgi:hypothetical protein